MEKPNRSRSARLTDGLQRRSTYIGILYENKRKYEKNHVLQAIPDLMSKKTHLLFATGDDFAQVTVI